MQRGACGGMRPIPGKARSRWGFHAGSGWHGPCSLAPTGGAYDSDDRRDDGPGNGRRDHDRRPGVRGRDGGPDRRRGVDRAADDRGASPGRRARLGAAHAPHAERPGSSRRLTERTMDAVAHHLADIPEHERPTSASESYAALLARLSQLSVTKHFDAYADVDWDA